MNRFFIALLCVLIIGYGVFEARRLVAGPQITVSAPQDGGRVASTTVTISGVAQNIAFLTINYAPAFTDAHGNFSVTLVPPPGYSVFTVAASDRFGRRTSKSVAFTTLTYCPA